MNQLTQERGGTRIVVADDNEDAAGALALLLELEGHDIRMAFDGNRALEEADRFHPQIMILDIDMPGRDGCEVANAVRARNWGAPVHLIALTGVDGKRERARATGAGFDHYILKPFDPRSLLRLVSEASRHAR
jgi:DNA-binding response OmpR family regulator